MAFADSDAVFASRAKEMGLDEKVMKPLNDAGFTSMATFAFSCAYIPGTADETPFVDMLKTALKRAPELAETARLRRLFHESYAVVSADLKAQVEQSDDAGVRKLAAPERAQRHKAQQERLQGIDISGANAPGDSLVDKCVAMYEADHLSYISWPHCVSRDHEFQILSLLLTTKACCGWPSELALSQWRAMMKFNCGTLSSAAAWPWNKRTC